MPSGTAAFAQKEARTFDKEAQPLLAEVTFHPVGNPLQQATEEQRRQFFQSLSRAVAHSGQPKTVSLHVKGTEEQGDRHSVSQVMVEKPHTAQPGSPRVSSPLYSIVYWSAIPAFRKAQESLAAVINEYAKGNEAKASGAVEGLEASLRSQGYAQEDVMAVLLLVIENAMAGESVRGQPPSAGAGQQPQAAQEKAQPSGLVPLELIAAARQSSQMRLASVREMLRYYAVRNPKQYHNGLCTVLGLSESVPEESEILQQRLSEVLELVGSFELAVRIAEEIKFQQKMDVERCLLELGYKYEDRQKRLIFGKRACGNRQQAKSILQEVLAAFNRKRMVERDLKPPSKASRMLSVRPRKPAAPD